MSDALHAVYRVAVTLDYILLGLFTVAAVLSYFTPAYSFTNSFVGRIVFGAFALYFYARWQCDIAVLPGYVESPSDADKAARFRALRDIYLEFACLLAVLSGLAVAKLRGDVAALEQAKRDD